MPSIVNTTDPASAAAGERTRMRVQYADYDRGRSRRWSHEIAANTWIEDERDRSILAAVPADADLVVDLGCGFGTLLGALEQHLDHGAAVGTEILRDRCIAGVAAGRSVMMADASALPFPPASVDVHLLMTVLSSVLSSEVRAAIGSEVERTLRPGGAVVVYDMARPNPGNPALRHLRRSDLAIFPSCVVESERSITVLPPLARRLRSLRWYRAASAVPLIHSHRLTVLRKRS